MTSTWLKRGVGWAALVAAVATGVMVVGCKKDEPTDQDYGDVASALGTLVAPEAEGSDGRAMTDAVDAAGGTMPAGFSAMGSGMLQGARGGVQYSYALTCRDAGGATLGACGPTTDAADLTVGWSGQLTLSWLSGMVTRAGHWTVSGLTTPTATFAGNGTFSTSLDLNNATGTVSAHYQLDYAASYDAIRYDRAARHATSGTARFHVEAERQTMTTRRTTERSFEIDAVVTFQADGSALITLDATHHFSVDRGGHVVRITNAR